MTPEFLNLICIELEANIDLTSLSFRKNVLRNNPNTAKFGEALAHLIAQS